MPKIQLASFYGAAVVFDTNIIRTKNDMELVPKSVSERLAKFRDINGVSVCIPRMVLEEYFFHRMRFLEQAWQRLEKEQRTISVMTNVNMPKSASLRSLKMAFYRRFAQWCNFHAVKRIRVPINEINWRGVIKNSVNRLAPFSPYDPENSIEKGFRDAIILETILHLAKGGVFKKVHFLSGDALLRDTVMARKEGSNINVYKNLEEYWSYIELEHSNFSKELSNVVLEISKNSFFARAMRSVYTTERISEIRLWGNLKTLLMPFLSLVKLKFFRHIWISVQIFSCLLLMPLTSELHMSRTLKHLLMISR